MYCLHWMLPVLFVPKSACALIMQDQMLVIILYLIAFFLERRPCILCIIVFIVAIVVVCYSGLGQCILCHWSLSHFFSYSCESNWIPSLSDFLSLSLSLSFSSWLHVLLILFEIVLTQVLYWYCSCTCTDGIEQFNLLNLFCIKISSFTSLSIVPRLISSPTCNVMRLHIFMLKCGPFWDI